MDIGPDYSRARVCVFLFLLILTGGRSLRHRLSFKILTAGPIFARDTWADGDMLNLLQISARWWIQSTFR